MNAPLLLGAVQNHRSPASVCGTKTSLPCFWVRYQIIASLLLGAVQNHRSPASGCGTKPSLLCFWVRYKTIAPLLLSAVKKNCSLASGCGTKSSLPCFWVRYKTIATLLLGAARYKTIAPPLLGAVPNHRSPAFGCGTKPSLPCFWVRYKTIASLLLGAVPNHRSPASGCATKPSHFCFWVRNQTIAPLLVGAVPNHRSSASVCGTNPSLPCFSVRYQIIAPLLLGAVPNHRSPASGCVFVLFSSSQALFDWIFGAKSERSSDGNLVMRSSGLKFEVQTADDKFLQLKDVIENLSELDSCNHIVVYKLKKRCGDLSEEDLGKLAVQLLNCQSSELAECTKDMDSTTWNSYQIVNNRARALCYATQQQQFRRLAEVTVNELMSSAHGQLQFLKELQKQEATQFESHEKIVADLTHIQQKSHDALNKLDDKLSILTCGALHISYFLFAALAASFLQAPPATRVALFTLVSLNATMEIQCGHNPPYFLSGSLPAPGQTGSQDAEETNQSPDTTTAGSPHDIPLSPVEIKQLTTNLVNESVASETSPGPRGDRSSKTADHSSQLDRPSTSAFTPYRRPEQARPDSSTVTMQRDDIAKVKRYLENLDENTSVSEFDMSETRNNSGARFRHSTPHRPASRGSTSTNRSYCQGITKTGTPCRSGCTNGSEFCHRHRVDVYE
ncbi:BMBL-like protein [Mya arenaria]|uniref:BMBL-like protein n=1 Tax=Mya arenaria TaxID=6604 RepID=A0ABY7F319_MYAAR|nr:BMBL-like protein [Mya arenaria]